MPVELGRLDQAHDDGCAFTRTQRAGEQPVCATERYRADAVLQPVVVDRQVAVVDLAYQRLPALEAVIDRLRARRSVGHLQAVDDEPLVQDIGDRPGALLAQPRTANRIEVLLTRFPFDFVELAEQLQRISREITAVVGVDLIELAPGVCLIQCAG